MKINLGISKMKKNILLFLMSLSFFITANAQEEEPCDQDAYRAESAEEAPSSCSEDPRVPVDNCCGDKTHFYAKIWGGANILQDTLIDGNRVSYQTGYIVAGALGYAWHYGLCIEGEYAYRRNAISEIDFFIEGSSDHGHLYTSSYMANLLWEVPLSSWGCGFYGIQPFVGAGIGYDCQRMHSSNSRIIFNQEWNHFSWQLMAGLAYPIFCNTEITLEYQFHQGNNHFYNHSIGLGLVYSFGFL
jgi:opacity protein-like surface antigen